MAWLAAFLSLGLAWLEMDMATLQEESQEGKSFTVETCGWQSGGP